MEIKIIHNCTYLRCYTNMYVYMYMQMGHVVFSAQRLDQSFTSRDPPCVAETGIGMDIDHPTDRCVIILNRTSVLRVKCMPGVCAYTGSSRARTRARRPCLEFSREFIQATTIIIKFSSVVIILYYNELRNRMINWNRKERNK